MYPRSRRAGAGHSHLMPLNEADTRAKLIDPALRQCGWTEDLVFREQTAGSIVLDGKRARRLAGRVDYLLRVRVNPGTQPVPLALIEAKAEIAPPEPRAGAGPHLCAPLQRAVRLLQQRPSVRLLQFDHRPHFGCVADRPVPRSRPASPALAGGDQGRSGVARRARPAHALPRRRRHAALLPGRSDPRRVRESRQGRKARAADPRHRGRQDVHRRPTAAPSVRRRHGAPRAVRLRPRRVAHAGDDGAFQPFRRRSGQGRPRPRRRATRRKNARIHIATYQSLGVDSRGEKGRDILPHEPIIRATISTSS